MVSRGRAPEPTPGQHPLPPADPESAISTRPRARSGAADARDGALPDADPEAVARDICLRLLTGQPRTRAELAAALAERNVPADAAETVLARFDEVGLIDDTAFAGAWVETRHRGRGLGKRALAHELRRRGVDNEVIQGALDQLDPDTEVETARALVARKLPSSRGLPTPRRVNRLVGMLARKGYPPGLAARVVREALADEGAVTVSELDTLDAMGEE
jgi:regulatory protein